MLVLEQMASDPARTRAGSSYAIYTIQFGYLPLATFEVWRGTCSASTSVGDVAVQI